MVVDDDGAKQDVFYRLLVVMIANLLLGWRRQFLLIRTVDHLRDASNLIDHRQEISFKNLDQHSDAFDKLQKGKTESLRKNELCIFLMETLTFLFSRDGLSGNIIFYHF